MSLPCNPMDPVFKVITDARQVFIQLLAGLSLEQLNQIPAGFNNSIIWNFGHIVVSTQALCYVRTGVKSDASFIKYLSKYAKGTKPEADVTAEEVDDLKSIALQSIAQLQADYQQGLFQHITPFETSTYLAQMQTFEEVLMTTAIHDNLHFGYALAQKRIINN